MCLSCHPRETALSCLSDILKFELFFFCCDAAKEDSMIPSTRRNCFSEGVAPSTQEMKIQSDELQDLTSSLPMKKICGFCNKLHPGRFAV